MRKGISTLVEVQHFVGMGSGNPDKDGTVTLDSRWAIPVSIAFGNDGATVSAACTLQGLKVLADGTYRYTLQPLVLDVRKSCEDNDLGSIVAGDGTDPGRDQGGGDRAG
jgi:hypothetical protein